MPSVTPHLWFDNEAEQAAELYTSIFPNSRIVERRRYENTGPDGTETATVVTFEIEGQRVIAMSAGPHFKLDEAFSFLVECETQDEVDTYWEKLTADGGQEGPCGWLKDRYGLSWQIAPKLLNELLHDPDKERANRVMRAMLQMKKIESGELQRAYDGPVGVEA
jgi:predicted 3-demethylubiquinone-9 3-methyltransferase (glyoxalase superfamily)